MGRESSARRAGPKGNLRQKRCVRHFAARQLAAATTRRATRHRTVLSTIRGIWKNDGGVEPMRRPIEAILFGAAFSLVSAMATAHITITSGPGFANATQIIKFGVGHGCDGLDTYSVKVEIPADVTGVRAMPSDFGRI